MWGHIQYLIVVIHDILYKCNVEIKYLKGDEE